MKKLFNEYEQGDSKTYQKYGGSGLGLVITKQLIDQMGGSIELESEFKVGTKVLLNIPFEMPAKLENSEVVPVHTIVDYSYKLKNKRILIVDDEEFNRILLKSILKKHEVLLFEAVNGEEAVQIAKNTNLDIIVMDIRMPVKNGVDATREIREFNKLIPIIASTAVASEEKITRCFNAGVTSVVFKPFKEIDLLNALAFVESNKDGKVHNSDSKNESSDVNFDSINEFISGDESFKKEMILTFKNSLENGIDNMQKALLNKEYLTICEIAHKIIPACKHFEAKGLVEILKKIENKRSEKMYNEKEIRDTIIIFEKQAKIIIEKINEYIEK